MARSFRPDSRGDQEGQLLRVAQGHPGARVVEFSSPAGRCAVGSWPGVRLKRSRGRRHLPAEAAQRNELTRLVLDTALALLSERHRAVIHLRIWEQLSFAQEIGALAGHYRRRRARMLYGRAARRACAIG